MELFRRKVKSGSKIGQKIGYPTINLNIGNFIHPHGVYICALKINKKTYKGALYFGHGINHKKNVLEIHILNFSENIYGKNIIFSIGKKIRSPKQFTNLQSLKKQIAIDLKSIV